MKSEIQLLIHELQKEHDLLEKEMNAHVKRMDFEDAEVLKKALFYTKDKLYKAHALADPNYRKVLGLKQNIKYCKNQLAEDEISLNIKKVIKRQIPLWEKELDDLQSQPTKIYIDSDEIIVHLEKLSNDELDFFQLEIEDLDLMIKFEKKEKILEIKIVITRKNKGQPDYELNKLKKFSFQIEGDTAILKINNFDSLKIQNLLLMLSRIVFDIFGSYRNRKPAIIKFTKS